MIEMIILGLLMKRPLCAYEIRKKILVSTARFYSMSFGTIFPALRKLEARSEITSLGMKAKKREWSITDSGRERFLAWLSEPMRVTADTNEHLLRLIFFRYLEKEAVGVLVRNFLVSIDAVIKELMLEQERLKDSADYFEISSLRFGIDYYRFMRGWYEALLREGAIDGYKA
jgi:DNA-binding PadR family transcriptional regulator